LFTLYFLTDGGAPKRRGTWGNLPPSPVDGPGLIWHFRIGLPLDCHALESGLTAQGGSGKHTRKLGK